jgi:hypothetical protein
LKALVSLFFPGGTNCPFRKLAVLSIEKVQIGEDIAHQTIVMGMQVLHYAVGVRL